MFGETSSTGYGKTIYRKLKNSRKFPHQSHVDRELHSDAHRGDENDNRNRTQLDSHQPHEAKELHRHEREHQHLRRNHISVRKEADSPPSGEKKILTSILVFGLLKKT